MAVAQAPELEVDLTVQAVENLVTQFSSALDFYRELVQNSIDAGSAAIEVWLEYIAGAEDEGTIAIHVDDFGEGMNEEIIDNQLTKLFSSSKDGDLTKIGKFGIGFVSIFAPGPKAVLLHTGRGGEAWEVCFDADRTFAKTRIDGPVEGTQITLFLAGDRARYRQIVADSKVTLRRWCAHSDVDVSFEDRTDGGGPEPINAPFAVPGECLITATHEGTEVVLAYHDAPEYGFYNKGLALTVSRDGPGLLGEHAPRLAHIGFKVKSRYLEHTLSRDTVVREGNFLKALQLIVQAADGPLHAALLQGLQDLVKQPMWSIADLGRYQALLNFLAREPIETLTRCDDRPLLRLVDGQPISLAAVWDAAREDQRVFLAGAVGPLEEHLLAAETPVLLGGRGRGQSALAAHGAVAVLVDRYAQHRHSRSLKGMLGRIGLPFGAPELLFSSPEDAFLRVRLVDPTPDEARLIRDAAELLESVGAGYRRLVACALDGVGGPLFVLGRALAPIMQRPQAGRLYVDRRPRRPEAAVDRGHPLFRRWLALQRTAPAMAAYCLAKDLLLVEDRLLGRDIALMAGALPDEASRFGGRR